MLKKYGLLALIAIAFIYLAICFFSPRNFRIQKELQVFGPPSLSYYLLNNVRDWPRWLSWKKEDSGIELSPGGRDVHVGGYLSFDGKKIGYGRMELVEAHKDSLVALKIVSNQLPSNMLLSFQLVPEGNRSIYITLRAGLEKGIPFWKRAWYKGLKFNWEKRLLADLEGIKAEMEKSIQGNFGIKQDEFPGRRFISIRGAIPANKIPSFLGSSYRKIYTLMDSLQLKVAGAPHSIILDHQTVYNQVYLAAALPIDADAKVPTLVGMDVIEIVKAPCLKIENFGSYNTLRNAHSKLDYFVENMELKIVTPFIEEYVTDPSQEPDTSKWLTNVYYLLNTGKNYVKGIERIETEEDVNRRNMENAMREMQEMERAEERKKKAGKK